ncbi:MAG: hypothetical protein L6R41_008149, partial [Letrouitia leprolyta]
MTTPLKRKAGDIAATSTKKPKANAAITSFFKQPASEGKTSQTSPLSSLTNPSPADSPVAAP